MADLNSAFDSEKSLDSDFDAEGAPTTTAKTPPAQVQPTSPLRILLNRFLNPPGHGAAGGAIGGAVGGIAGGLPGMAAGAFAGNLIGQKMLVGDEAVDPKAMEQYRKSGRIPTDYVPAKPPSRDLDYGSAAMDAGTQGVLGGAFKLAGMGAAKLGFPRVAGLLGAKTPMQAVVDSTPNAVKGVSTPMLEAVDSAGTLGGAAAKEKAALLSDQARRNAVLALERGISENAMAPIQSRMPARVPGLAQASGDYASKLRALGLPEDVTRKAFADGPSVMEAASDLPSMQARQQMVQRAVPQTVDNQALKMVRRPIAAAEARGVATSAADQSAADAAGLRTMGGAVSPTESYATRMVNKVPGMGTAAQFLSGGGMLSGDRVMQDTAAQLAARGGSTVNPMLEKLLSTNPAYKAGAVTPQFIEDLLRRFGNR